MEVAVSSDIGLTVVCNSVETLSRFHRIRYVWQAAITVRTRGQVRSRHLNFAAKRRYNCREGGYVARRAEAGMVGITSGARRS
jgi:hypothetical protein